MHAAILLAAFLLSALAAPTRSFAQTPTFNTLVSTYTNTGSLFPESATVGDFNGDGKPDAILTDGQGALRVMLGQGNGAFTERDVGLPAVSTGNVVGLPSSLVSGLPSPVGIGTVRAVDVNGDGKLDVVCNTGSSINFSPRSFVTVLLNTGNDGTGLPQFATTYFYSPFNGLRPIIVGDLNGDSSPDLVVGTSGGGILVWTNNGSGAFTLGQIASLNPGAGGPSAGPGIITDLNGDGKADCVVTSNQNGGANIFYGNGNGTLQTPGYFLANQAVSVAAADVNGDGRPDLLMGDLSGGLEGLRVYLNSSSGFINSPIVFPIAGLAGYYGGGASLAARDINGDGKLDAVLSNLSNNTVVVLLGVGDGSFSAPVAFPASFSPTYVFVDDFNADGKPDIGVVLRNTRSFGVLTNTTPFAPPAQLYFTDALTGPSSSDLAAIPAGKYGYTVAGLQRTQSSSTTDRPLVSTALKSYLNEQNFTAEVTVTLANNDLLYFGLGQGDMDPSYFNEPNHAFYFRVHSGWQGNYSIQADVRSPSVFTVNESQFGAYALGSTITLRISRAGDAVTMSVVGRGSVTYSLAAYPSLGLTASNTRVFFGNSSVGSVFSDLKIYPAVPDTTAPVISAPANITQEATGPAGAIVTFTATAEDDVDGPVSVLADPASGSTFALGTSIVDLAASDEAGNIASASFNVTVRDTTAPAVTAPADISVEATGATGAAVTFSASATDLVDGPVAVSASPASGSTFALGTTSVALSATDSHHNVGGAAFNVTVKDTTAPVITAPANLTVEATSAAGATVTFAASASDLVDGSTPVTALPASGSTFAIGTTAVTLSSTDAHHNVATAGFSVTVKDTTAPALTSVTPSLDALWSPNHKLVAISVAASASDATGVTSLKIVNVTSSEPDNGLGDGDTANDIQVTGDLTVNLRAERSGSGNGRVYTITVEARDAYGNATTRTCTVAVPKSKGK